MTLIIKKLDNTNENTWDDVVFSSSFGTIFHTINWLRLAQEQTNTEFLPLIFYKGTQLVAIYPIFLKKQGPIKVALSPPSRSYMSYLGPVIANYDSLKQDKKESTYNQIQEAMDNYIFKIKKCKYARIRTSPGLYDSRPLKWSGYTIVPYYTYRIDLTAGIDHVWKQCDNTVRRAVNQSEKEALTVRNGDKEDLEFIYDSMWKRYVEQGIKPTDYKIYLHAIYKKYYPNNLKIFVADYKGQRIGGLLSLCFKNIVHFWVGLPKTNLAKFSPNEKIIWEAIKWAQTNGFDYCELMDAGVNPRLRHFKSKFNPNLVVWFSATKYSSTFFKASEKLFNIARRKGFN